MVFFKALILIFDILRALRCQIWTLKGWRLEVANFGTPSARASYVIRSILPPSHSSTTYKPLSTTSSSTTTLYTQNRPLSTTFATLPPTTCLPCLLPIPPTPSLRRLKSPSTTRKKNWRRRGGREASTGSWRRLGRR